MNEGARALRKWRLGIDITQAAACRQLEFSEARYCRLEKGQSLPTRAPALTLRRVAAIPIDRWDVTVGHSAEAAQ